MKSAKRKFTIGRNPSCDLALGDDTVSEQHAEVAFIGNGKILLIDTNSTNGTWIVINPGKEQRVHQQLVSPLDKVRFGSFTLSMKEVLEALRSKFPHFEETLNRPAPKDEKPWVSGRTLIRCECGAIIKPEDPKCPECGQ